MADNSNNASCGNYWLAKLLVLPLRALQKPMKIAQYALEQEKDKAKAKQYAEEAKKLATCDGPPYYYKVAYEEAERMLEKL